MKLTLDKIEVTLEGTEVMDLLGWLAGQACRNNEVLTQLKELTMKVSELAGAVLALDAKLEKAQIEILNKIAELEAALENLELPEAAVVAMQGLVDTVQALDDIVPDAEPPVEPPAP